VIAGSVNLPLVIRDWAFASRGGTNKPDRRSPSWWKLLKAVERFAKQSGINRVRPAELMPLAAPPQARQQARTGREVGTTGRGTSAGAKTACGVVGQGRRTLSGIGQSEKRPAPMHAIVERRAAAQKAVVLAFLLDPPEDHSAVRGATRNHDQQQNNRDDTWHPL
jgi:hypothetical protein